MSDANEIVRQRQSAIRRELDRRGIPLKVVSCDSGIPYQTLLTYFPPEGGARPVMLPMSAVYCLLTGKAISDDLLSLLLPAGRAIVQIPEGIDHDEVEAAARDFLAAKGAAHHPLSEAGRDIGPGEAAVLSKKVVSLVAVAA
jgi:hypothetical protein